MDLNLWNLHQPPPPPGSLSNFSKGMVKKGCPNFTYKKNEIIKICNFTPLDSMRRMLCPVTIQGKTERHRVYLKYVFFTLLNHA